MPSKRGNWLYTHGTVQSLLFAHFISNRAFHARLEKNMQNFCKDYDYE